MQLQITGTSKQPSTQLCFQLSFLYLPRFTLCLKPHRHTEVSSTESQAETKCVISISKDYLFLSSKQRD